MDRSMLQLLNYCATHPDAVIQYKQSYMIIEIHSDVSYLSNPKSCSRVVGHFFLTNKPKLGQHIMNNVAVHLVFTIICNVISSTADSEIAALYINEKGGVIIQNVLEEMANPQLEILYRQTIPHQKS